MTLEQAYKKVHMMDEVLSRSSSTVMCSNLSRTPCQSKRLMKKVFLKKFEKRLDTRSKM